MGWLLAYCSVLLVSAAQLLLKWAMVRLPAIGEPSAFITELFSLTPAVQALLAGVLAYALSMLCWLLALRRIALSRAYPLLSLSYLLVWAAALWLPGLNEAFVWGKLAGGGLILAGLLLICWPQKKTR